MRIALDAASLAAVKDASAETFDVDRFVKRTASPGEDRYTKKSTYADGAAFDGRLKVLRAEERPADVSKERVAVRLTVPAGSATFAAKDRFEDTVDDVEYEILRPVSPASSVSVVDEWYAVEVRS